MLRSGKCSEYARAVGVVVCQGINITQSRKVLIMSSFQSCSVYISYLVYTIYGEVNACTNAKQSLCDKYFMLFIKACNHLLLLSFM